MSRLLPKHMVEELMRDLGIAPTHYAIEGKRLVCIVGSARRSISLELQIAEGESGAVARIHRTLSPEPVFLDI